MRQAYDEGVEVAQLKDFAEKAYLNYSMYVILDRALPSLADGMKPVQRRIVYAMSELGLRPDSKYKKSARTVGDVLGKYHPHGDSACYEAMVLMAQPFSYRYPLIDGQGNWGAQDDPKSFAAMRYTESKLSPYAQALLSEIGQGTTDWQPNFDGTMREPALLPARLPNLLLNGASGIAVGMATDVPPHNLTETLTACIHLLHNPKASLAEILAIMPAPDLPTGGVLITPKDDLEKMYRTGLGSYRVRASYRVEQGEVVIDQLPWQVSGGKVIEQVAAQMRDKKLPMLEDIRDESDHENPTRLVLVPRSNRVKIDEMMLHLFATTDLEQSYRVNLNVIGLDGLPAVKSLPTLLTEWLDYREAIVRRRLSYRLEKVEARLHILAGLLAVYLNIDEVIEVIRGSDDPKADLMAKFGLTEIQAEAILEIRLRQLAKLEEIKLRGEQADLEKERDSLSLTLGSDRRMKTLMRKEFEELITEYGDARRTQLSEAQAAVALSEEKLVPSEPVTVVLSKQGWIRAAKGQDVDASALSYRGDDGYFAACASRTNQAVLLLDSQGRAFNLAVKDLPSARGQGEPLTGHLTLDAKAKMTHLLPIKNDQHLLLYTPQGVGFLAPTEAVLTRQKAGKQLINFDAGGKLAEPVWLDNLQDYLVLVSSEGRMLIYPLGELPVLSKGKGNKLISIKPDETIIFATIFKEGMAYKLHAGKRYLSLKPADWKAYLGGRAKRGHVLPKGFTQISAVEVMGEVSAEEAAQSPVGSVGDLFSGDLD